MKNENSELTSSESKTKMNWRFWAKWEGIDYEKAYFNLEGMDEFDLISYDEYLKRLYRDH